jgi:hypothetical protein
MQRPTPIRGEVNFLTNGVWVGKWEHNPIDGDSNDADAIDEDDTQDETNPPASPPAASLHTTPSVSL